jgi:hypothetical protein
MASFGDSENAIKQKFRACTVNGCQRDTLYNIGSKGGRPRMKSDAFSAIIMVVA